MTAIEFLRSIVSALVNHTDSIEITEKTDELWTLLSLQIDPSDMGSLIGKWWKTIESVRTVMRVFGSKSGMRINIRIIEDAPRLETIK